MSKLPIPTKYMYKNGTIIDESTSTLVRCHANCYGTMVRVLMMPE